MATVSERMVPELDRLLSRLAGRIRRYVLLEGMALLLAVMGGLFWLSLAVDHLWFQISYLELPRWFRIGFNGVVLGLTVCVAISAVVLRMLRSLRRESLALVLERRFPQLNDRLVTAVEMTAPGATTSSSDLTRAMLRRTVDEAVDATRQLELASVFDRQPLKRALAAASVAILSIGILAAASQSTLAVWKDSFLSLEDEYWNRECELTVQVLAQPGDIVREFKDHFYKHPRGADLTLLIEAREGRRIPERVQLRYRMANGRGQGTVLCSRVGERQFRYSLAGLLDDVEFRIYGGDFVNRRMYQIHVVEAPQLERIELACFFPEYTGRAHPESTPQQPRRDVVTVRGTQVSLPAETEFLLQGRSNKPLTHVRIQFGQKELTFGTESAAAFIERTESGSVQTVQRPADSLVKRWLSEDGQSITVPFVLSQAATSAAKARLDTLATEAGPPFVLAPDTPVRISLEDADGILTPEPARVTISSIADQQPVVETRLRGIGTSITRRASVPILGKIVDDYGLASVRFEFQLNGQDQWQRRELEAGLSVPGATEFILQRSKDDVFERFSMVPLDLKIGDQVVVSVATEDRDHLNGPHLTRGERYSFKVVSNEELQSLLYQRELNLRRQFEQIVTEVKETQQDLIRHRARIDQARQLQAELAAPRPPANDGNANDAARQQLLAERTKKQEELNGLRIAVTGSAERSLHAVRKNAGETASVELSFRDIREELINNELHTPQTLERIDDRIVTPLQSINATDFPEIDRAIGRFRLANERGQDSTSEIDGSIDLLGGLITRMEKVLAEMEKLKEFQKAVEELRKIIEEQETLLDRTKTERRKGLLKGLLDE